MKIKKILKKYRVRHKRIKKILKKIVKKYTLERSKDEKE